MCSVSCVRSYDLSLTLCLLCWLLPPQVHSRDLQAQSEQGVRAMNELEEVFRQLQQVRLLALSFDTRSSFLLLTLSRPFLLTSWPLRLTSREWIGSELGGSGVGNATFSLIHLDIHDEDFLI